LFSGGLDVSNFARQLRDIETAVDVDRSYLELNKDGRCPEIWDMVIQSDLHAYLGRQRKNRT
jgi:hypothetical protein